MREDPKNAHLNDLKKRFALLADLGQAAGLLAWDQSTYMPSGAAAARGQQLASLDVLAHEKLTDGVVERALGELEGAYPDDSDEAALLVQARRTFDRAAKLPADFIEARSIQSSKAQQVWATARRQDDFGLFAPELEHMLELARQEADLLGFDEHPYDALHDRYEPGSTAMRVRALFELLRTETVALLEAIRASGADPDDTVLRGSFAEGKQEQFAIEVVKGFGYDFMRGRLDRTVHPFAQPMGKHDVRITTRYSSDFLSPALFGTMHEAGHAMYEQNVADSYQRTPLGQLTSLSLHESQSRLWENLVGRSYAFWEGAYPRLQELFPAALGDTRLDAFYGAVNRVQPSFIRVDADEVTYNLHVLVRFELELALLEASLNVADLPDAWNAKYEAYLGLTPPSDAQGCLQDTHWSHGLFGYFPTYTLGNLMSVQLFEAARAALPDLDAELRAGRFGSLLTWLRDHVYCHGSKYTSDSLLERATGKPLDAELYVAYLKRKFGALYGL